MSEREQIVAFIRNTADRIISASSGPVTGQILQMHAQQLGHLADQIQAGDHFKDTPNDPA